ncbi:MAG: FG-GAP repeat protein [Phycisphaerae bacterium]
MYEQSSGGTWLQTAFLTANNAVNSDEFGYSVALRGDVAIIGALNRSTPTQSAGAAYVFQRRSDGTWSEIAQLVAPDGAPYDHFGAAVALSADTAVVGAPDHDLNAIDIEAGAAYAFSISRDLDGNNVMDACECLGDLNADRAIDELDLGLLL